MPVYVNGQPPTVIPGGNTVDSAAIVDGSVTSVDIADGGVANVDIGETISVANGGTGSTTESGARTSLGTGGLVDTNTWQSTNEFQGNVFVTSGGAVGADAAGAASVLFAARRTADGSYRWEKHADGSEYWGDGTGGTDTSLSRSGANELTSGGSFKSTSFHTADVDIAANVSIGSGLVNVYGGLSTDLAYIAATLVSASHNFEIYRNGKMKWGDGVSAPTVVMEYGFGGTLNITTPQVISSGNITSDSVSTSASGGFQARTGALLTDLLIEGSLNSDAVARIKVDRSGLIQWGDGTGSSDVSMARLGASSIGVTGKITANSGGAFATVIGNVGGVAGISVNSGSVNLYENTAGHWLTDHSLQVSNDLKSARSEVTGQQVVGVVTVTSNTTLTSANYCIYGDTTGGTFTITLPATHVAGLTYEVKNIGAVTSLTVARNGSTINRLAADLTVIANTSFTIRSSTTDTDWEIH